MVKRDLRQVCVAVAILLFLYGILQLLKSISDLASISVSYYLWIAFQIIVAILIIFIGFKAYSVAKALKAASLTPLWREAQTLFLVSLLGCIALLPAILYPLPASNSIYPQPFQSYSLHNPISFLYRLDYRWNLQSGGSVGMYTTYSYPTMPYQILIDVIPTIKGWIIIPYKIDGSNAIAEAFGPARAEIKLGMIENGDYDFKVVMSDATDEFQIHKTDNQFWVDEVKVTKGSVAQKSEFEKRLDGFTLGYGWAESNEVRFYALDLVREAAGEIIDPNIPEYPNPISIRFYFNGTFGKLSNIILDLAKQYPNASISISGNDGDFAATYKYVSVILVLPKYADQMRTLITEYGLVIYDEKEQGNYADFIELHVSSAFIEKQFGAIRILKSLNE